MKTNLKLNLPLIAFASISLLSCTNSNNQDNDGINDKDGIIEEYYDVNWKPGKNAIKGATQPTIKNPVGITNELNDMRRSQDKMGLPSQGEANILVVPVTFKGDENVIAYDLTFTKDDINVINNLYFQGSRNDYPSVKDFYEKSSYDKLHLNGVVSPVVTFDTEFLTFVGKAVNGNATVSQLHAELTSYVYNYLFNETQTYYIGDFDSDNDHRVDSIHLMINYPLGYSTGNELLDSAITQFLNYDNVYFRKDLLDKTPVNSYVVTSEYIRKIESAGGDASHFAVVQVGYQLGLDNMSDLTANLDQTYLRAPYAYKDLLDGYVGDHNAFSKYQLGWISPKLLKMGSIEGENLHVELRPFESSGDAIILYSGEHSLFSEYLIVDYYTPTGLNSFDATSYTVLGTNVFTIPGIRVTKVDARLLRGYGDNFYPYSGAINLNSKLTLPNGDKVNYVYDYWHTNNYINNYYNQGITDNEPLCSLLDSFGFNRHITAASDLLFDINYTNSLLFHAGDSFGSDEQIEGCYKNFKFNSGDKLGLSFDVSSLANNRAVVVLKEVK